MEFENTTYDGKPIEAVMPPSTPSAPEPDSAGEPRGWFTPIANVVSWAFVPLMMPFYGILLIFHLSILSYTPLAARAAYAAVVFGFCCLIPMFLIFLLKSYGIISDIGLNKQKERPIPYILCIATLLGTSWFFHYKDAPTWIWMFFLGGATSGLVNLIINFWWKISVHCAGAGGLVALMMYLTCDTISPHNPLWWLIGAILLAGLLGTARIWLGRHTLMQVLAGYATGYLSIWLFI